MFERRRDGLVLGLVVLLSVLVLCASFALVPLASHLFAPAAAEALPGPSTPTPKVVATPLVTEEGVELVEVDGSLVPADGSYVLDEDQLLQMAHDICPRALGAGSCDDVDVVLVDFWDPQVGEADLWTDLETGRMGSSRISLDPDLVGLQTALVEQVIAHEWNHVEQAFMSTDRQYSEMSAAADRHFAPRARKGVEVNGLELLTDCMTVIGDGYAGPTYPGHGPYITTYVEQMLDVKSMEQACGKDWKSLLPQSK